MEAEDQNLSHYFNLFQGNPSLNDNFNSILQQNPHDNQDENFHVHDHYQYHNHDQPMDQEKRLREWYLIENQVKKLQMQVEQLMASNQLLSNKVISLLEYNNQILQENSQLKETLSSFHQYIYLIENVVILSGNINDSDINQQSPHRPTW